MATITVAQLKAAVASIPAGANAWQIQVPDGLALNVVNNITTGPRGENMVTVKGYVHLDTLTWEAA